MWKKIKHTLKMWFSFDYFTKHYTKRMTCDRVSELHKRKLRTYLKYTYSINPTNVNIEYLAKKYWDENIAGERRAFDYKFVKALSLKTIYE